MSQDPPKRYILLEVDEAKADSLLTALLQRSYVKQLDFDVVEQRRKFTHCPACKEELVTEWNITVTEKMLECCLTLLEGMRKTKSIVVYNKSFLEEVRPIDRERSTLFPYKLLYAARLLGIVGHFLDGSQDTFFITERGLNFLSGIEPLSPCELAVVRDSVLKSTGSMMITEVKRRDHIKFGTLLTNLDQAVDKLPREVLDFVRSGQTTLL